MEDLSKRSHLLNRNGHYYLRVRVPVDLLDQYHPQVEIKRSLKTKDLKEAKLRLSIELLKVEEEFQKKRRQKPPAPSISTQPIAQALTKVEVERIVLLWHHQCDYEIGKEDDHQRVNSGEEVVKEMILTQYEELQALQSHDECAYASQIQFTARKIFTDHGLNLNTQPEEIQQFAYSLVKQASIEQAHSTLKRLGQPVDREPFTLFKTAQSYSTITQPNPDHTPLKKVLSKFQEAKINEGMQPKTLSGYKLTFDFLIELFGENRNIKEISVEDCRTYRDKLSLLPSNARKRFPHLSLLDAIKQLPEGTTERLSPVSVNTHLKNLSAFFNFAVGDGYLDKNPMLMVKAKANHSTKPRIPFESEHLITLFNTPIYRGCVDDNASYNKAGSNHPRRHRFWIPLLGLWTGMRLNEICQLFTDDIKQIEGIYVIQVQADKDGLKKLKTTQSKRTIPIHNTLLAMGFLQYVEKMKNTGSLHLFPELPISESHTNRGSRSAIFSKWFNNFLVASNIKEDGLCFHSFRHGFRDACRHVNMNDEIVEALGGWKNSDKVMNTYGKGHKLKKLQEEINKIDFEGLELSHLMA